MKEFLHEEPLGLDETGLPRGVAEQCLLPRRPFSSFCEFVMKNACHAPNGITNKINEL
jgi:hypothetical protein